MDRMIIAKISEGLGNQLFMYANAYAISKKSISVFIDSIADELKEKQIYITDLVSGGVKSSITKNRSNYDKLIDPEELASQIYEITKRKKTLTIRRIELTRSK